jgi:hypothetical protein
MSVLRRSTTLAAMALIATCFTGGTAAMASAPAAHRPQAPTVPNTIEGKDTGYGTTLQAAEQQARVYLLGDYYGCVQPFVYIGDGQYANGTWWATIAATCKGVY